jgi:hypothetical protein
MKKVIQKRNQLLEKVRALNGFQTHLKIYALVNWCLWLVWLLFAGMNIYSWPVYFTLIWSCILFVHYTLAEKVFHNGNKKSE